jgi:hypothetical protein
LSEGFGHFSQKPVPGRVSSPVVHLLQTVHINEHDDQPISLSPGPIDLVLQFSKARAPPQHPGEVIDQVVPSLIAFSVECRLGSIEPGLVPVQGSLVPVQGSLVPVQGSLVPMQIPLVAWVGGASFKGRLFSVQLGLVVVKHDLVSIQGLLGVGEIVAGGASGGGTSLLRPFRPLRPSLPEGRSVRFADRFVSVILDFPQVEDEVIAKLVSTILVWQPGSPCCPFSYTAAKSRNHASAAAPFSVLTRA